MKRRVKNLSQLNKTKRGNTQSNETNMKIRNLGTKIDWVTHNSITKNTCVLFSKTSWRPTMLACFSLKRWALVGVELTAPSQGRRWCGSRKLRAVLQHFYGLTCKGVGKTWNIEKHLMLNVLKRETVDLTRAVGWFSKFFEKSIFENLKTFNM